MTDLNALIGNTPQETDQQDLSNQEAITSLVDNMTLLAGALENLNAKLGKIEEFVHSLHTRAEISERHLSFLLTKDPEVGPKMVEIARKLKEEEAAASTEVN